MCEMVFTERANSQDRAALQPLRDKMRDIMITDLANELLLEVAKDKTYTYLIQDDLLTGPIEKNLSVRIS